MEGISTCTDKMNPETKLKILEEIADGLLRLDWCIGYEFTADMQVELDRLRDMAYKLQVEASLAEGSP